MAKLKLLSWWQFHFSGCRIIQAWNCCSGHNSEQKVRTGWWDSGDGNHGRKFVCVILEFVAMKERSAVTNIQHPL